MPRDKNLDCNNSKITAVLDLTNEATWRGRYFRYAGERGMGHVPAIIRSIEMDGEYYTIRWSGRDGYVNGIRRDGTHSYDHRFDLVDIIDEIRTNKYA